MHPKNKSVNALVLNIFCSKTKTLARWLFHFSLLKRNFLPQKIEKVFTILNDNHICNTQLNQQKKTMLNKSNSIALKTVGIV